MAVRSHTGVPTLVASLPKEVPLNSNASPFRLPSLPFLRPATAFVGSLLASAPAAFAALNYEDVVKRASQSASSSFPDVTLPSVELPAVDFDGAGDFVSANPVALAVGLLAVAVPLVASRAFASPALFGSVSGVEAFEKLSNPELNAQLLDIRAPADIKAEGSPNLKAIRKRNVTVAYAAEDDGFVDKVFAKFKNPENTTLYILDRFDGNAASVAKLLTNSGFKGAFAIKGGAEGPNGWQDKELPWASPSKSFSINVDGLKNILGNSKDAGNLVPTTVGVAAAAGVGLVVFSEAETTLQLLGTVALAQLFVKKFLFVEDRKKTIEEFKTFLDQKIAPKEFVGEIKDVGRALLPKDSEVKGAVASGATVLEKELGVSSVTPEAIGEKAKEKLGEEAAKSGIEIPDVGAITSDLKSGAQELQANVKEAASEFESAAKETTNELGEQAAKVGAEIPDAEEVKSDLNSSAQKVQSNVEEAASDLQSSAEETTNELGAKIPDAEEVKSDINSSAQGVQANVKEVASDLQSTAEETTNGSAAPVGEEESPVAKPASEPSSKTAASVAEVTPFFESDKPSSQPVSSNQ